MRELRKQSSENIKHAMRFSKTNICIESYIWAFFLWSSLERHSNTSFEWVGAMGGYGYGHFTRSSKKLSHNRSLGAFPSHPIASHTDRQAEIHGWDQPTP